jgi:glutamyl-tRNA reductase
VQEREPLVFSRADAVLVLERFASAGRSVVLLSTCNRCELYWWGDGDGEAWFRELAQDRGATLTHPLVRHAGMSAVRHLFLVGAGLDSQILGEMEILSQLRRAYDAARAAGTTTSEMDAIFSAALSSGRRVRRDTLLGRHPASVSSAAVDLAGEIVGPGPRRVVVLGAGEVAEGVLRALHQEGQSRVTLLSRKPEPAKVLAEAWTADSRPWDELEPRLASADLLLVATSAPRPVISADQMGRVAAVRAGRELLVMDLGVPRNVEPISRAIPGIRLLDLDDLQRLRCPGEGLGSASLAEAEALIEEELIRLGLSLRGRGAAPTLAELHRLSHEIAEKESAWALAQLDHLSEPQREIVRQMADRLVRRVLYPVSRSLRVD